MDAKKKKFLEDRMFFLGVLFTVLLGVMLLDWDAMVMHPVVARADNEIRPVTPLSPNEAVTNITFVIFDTETTGIDTAIDRVVELAAVKMRGGEVLGEKSWLLNPERYIPEEISSIHHITPEMVRDQPTYAEIHDEFMDFIGDAVLIAHNARFDVTMMNMEFTRAERVIPFNVTLDSLRIFRDWYDKLASHNLGALAEHLDIQLDGAFHRAGADSIYVGKILHQAVMERNPDMRFGALIEASNPIYHFDVFEPSKPFLLGASE